MGRSRVTDDQLRAAAEHAQTMVDLLTRLGLVPCGGNYAMIRRRLLVLGPLDRRFGARAEVAGNARLRTLSDGALAAAVASSSTYAGVLRQLGLPVDSRLHRLLKQTIQARGLDVSHFSGQAWARGTRRARTPLAQLLVEGRPTASGNLRRRLVAEGLLDPCCSTCRRTTWLGLPIALELDHVNGVRDDNRLENLRLLCPNCHAQTDTWRGRNIPRRAARS